MEEWLSETDCFHRPCPKDVKCRDMNTTWRLVHEDEQGVRV